MHRQRSGMAADATMVVVGQAVAVIGRMVGRVASRLTSLMTGGQQHSRHAHRVRADPHPLKPASCVRMADTVQVSRQCSAFAAQSAPL
jgi:hypothetical protein